METSISTLVITYHIADGNRHQVDFINRVPVCNICNKSISLNDVLVENKALSVNDMPYRKYLKFTKDIYNKKQVITMQQAKEESKEKETKQTTISLDQVPAPTIIPEVKKEKVKRGRKKHAETYKEEPKIKRRTRKSTRIKKLLRGEFTVTLPSPSILVEVLPNCKVCGNKASVKVTWQKDHSDYYCKKHARWLDAIKK